MAFADRQADRQALKKTLDSEHGLLSIRAFPAERTGHQRTFAAYGQNLCQLTNARLKSFDLARTKPQFVCVLQTSPMPVKSAESLRQRPGDLRGAQAFAQDFFDGSTELTRVT
mmetsp:Transcript_6471/g.7574  ORF Transcript_6471/g.7574 Transcript_6471/m.7574 type:complete len:113 (+) Transcript_6471:335-673(+)